ncbi:hypothetical protein PENTCL1PPCAC_5458, partial [Pristionchus entomophagus]
TGRFGYSIEKIIDFKFSVIDSTQDYDRGDMAWLLFEAEHHIESRMRYRFKIRARMLSFMRTRIAVEMKWKNVQDRFVEFEVFTSYIKDNAK